MCCRPFVYAPSIGMDGQRRKLNRRKGTTTAQRQGLFVKLVPLFQGDTNRGEWAKIEFLILFYFNFF
jgi:hypothetical protein